MTALFNRAIFFDKIRPMFAGGKLTPLQVAGMEFKLDVWEEAPWSDDLRWLAYPFATVKWETGERMIPVREGFKESDASARLYVKAQGYPYAVVDPETGQVYYGRGDIQTTWRENYRTTTQKLNLKGLEDLEWYPEKMLNPEISARAMYMGMVEGWYRKSKDGRRQTLKRYFSETENDPYMAREIINGDKTKVPNWTGGVSIGHYIATEHLKFLAALHAARLPEPAPEPAPAVAEVTVIVPKGMKVNVVEQEETS